MRMISQASGLMQSSGTESIRYGMKGQSSGHGLGSTHGAVQGERDLAGPKPTDPAPGAEVRRLEVKSLRRYSPSKARAAKTPATTRSHRTAWKGNASFVELPTRA